MFVINRSFVNVQTQWLKGAPFSAFIKTLPQYFMMPSLSFEPKSS